MDDDFFRDKFVISTHALREEGDLYTLSRPRQGLVISTHALREEGDRGRRQGVDHYRNFYPRPPRGGRRGAALRLQDTRQFLPTPSARRATCCC